MKAIATNNITSNKRLIALFVLLVLSSVKMFGQEVKAETTVFISTEVVAAIENPESQMELVSWFMGTKQSQVSDSINTTSTTSTNKTGKKQFINNGLSTNRILSRTFLKKATASQIAIA
jgi:phosphoserine aminotransferase